MDGLTKIFIVGLAGFYFGGGFSENPVKYDNPQKVIDYKIVEIPVPTLPRDCESALRLSTETLLAIDEDIRAYDSLVTSCFVQAGLELQAAEREIIVTGAFDRFKSNESESDDYSEEQIEEAFETCEIEYEDPDYCDEVLEDFLEDVEPAGN